MSKREPSVLLDDIRTSIEKIQRYTAGFDEGSFLVDEKTTDAVLRNLEIIGEAAKQRPVQFKKRHSAIAWLQIAGLRNRIVHDYAGIDLKLLWNILQTAIPKLALQIAKLNNDHRGSSRFPRPSVFVISNTVSSVAVCSQSRYHVTTNHARRSLIRDICGFPQRSD